MNSWWTLLGYVGIPLWRSLVHVTDRFNDGGFCPDMLGEDLMRLIKSEILGDTGGRVGY